MDKQSNLIEHKSSLKVGMFNLCDGRNVEKLDADTYPKLRSVIAIVDESRNYALGLCPVNIMLSFAYGCLNCFTDEILSGREATAVLLEEAAKQKLQLPAAEFCVNYDKSGVSKGEAFLPSRYELKQFSHHSILWSAWEKLGIINGNCTFWSSSVGDDRTVWMQSSSEFAVSGWHIQYRTFGVLPAVEIKL